MASATSTSTSVNPCWRGALMAWTPRKTGAAVGHHARGLVGPLLVRQDHLLGPIGGSGPSTTMAWPRTMMPGSSHWLGSAEGAGLQTENLFRHAPAHHGPGWRGTGPGPIQQRSKPGAFALQHRLPVVAHGDGNARRGQRHDADDHQQFPKREAHALGGGEERFSGRQPARARLESVGRPTMMRGHAREGGTRHCQLQCRVLAFAARLPSAPNDITSISPLMPGLRYW